MKPELPSVEGAAWVKAYKPSGICPPNTILLMLGVGALAGIAAGAVGYVGGYVTGWLAIIGLGIIAFMSRFGGCAGLVFLILFAIVFPLGIGAGYPALLGYGLGTLIWRLAKQGKCRNVGLASGIALLCGVIAYGVFAWITVSFGGGLHETSRLTRHLLADLSSTSGWMYLIVAVDAIILILVTFATVLTSVSDTPFCEECNEWYGEPVKALYPADLAAPLFATLNSGIPQDLDGKSQLPADAKVPRLALSLQRCSCNQADYKFSATLHWQETKVEKGETKVEDKSENWFTTMMPASLGRQLAGSLFTGPAPAPALKPS